MAEVLCVYQEVAIPRAAGADAARACPGKSAELAQMISAAEVDAAKACHGPESGAVDNAAPNVAFISYDEKPGIQAISNTAPDLPPVAGEHACVARDQTCRRWRANMPASRATMSTSVMAQ
jgi:hypothetical protein